MHLGRSHVAAIAAFLLLASLSPAASRTRSVTGVVTDKRGNALSGAAVQLENSGSLAIASYITRADGRYFFHQLSPDVDFTLTAKYRRWFSKSKVLSTFDTKDPANIDLQIPID